MAYQVSPKGSSTDSLTRRSFLMCTDMLPLHMNDTKNQQRYKFNAIPSLFLSLPLHQTTSPLLPQMPANEPMPLLPIATLTLSRAIQRKLATPTLQQTLSLLRRLHAACETASLLRIQILETRRHRPSYSTRCSRSCLRSHRAMFRRTFESSG
jgi:hypothetical protein